MVPCLFPVTFHNRHKSTTVRRWKSPQRCLTAVTSGGRTKSGSLWTLFCLTPALCLPLPTRQALLNSSLIPVESSTVGTTFDSRDRGSTRRSTYCLRNQCQSTNSSILWNSNRISTSSSLSIPMDLGEQSATGERARSQLTYSVRSGGVRAESQCLCNQCAARRAPRYATRFRVRKVTPVDRRFARLQLPHGVDLSSHRLRASR